MEIYCIGQPQIVFLILSFWETYSCLNVCTCGCYQELLDECQCVDIHTQKLKTWTFK